MEASVLTPVAAIAAGLATSLHCSAMCGPLACAVRAKPLDYHLGRLVSYTALGAVCGTVGQAAVTLIKADGTRVVPWVLAGILLLMALGWERHLPQPRFLAAWLLRLRLNRSLGLLTPLLPCGPLWLMLGAAAIAGSLAGGALLMACFVVGTIPLPFLLQSQAARLRRHVTPDTLRRLQRGVAFASALVLAWRAMIPADGSCH